MSDIAYILLKANNKTLTKERDDAEKALQDVLSVLEKANISNFSERSVWASVISEARVRLVKALEHKKGLERLAEFYADQYAKHDMGEPSVFDEFDESPKEQKEEI